MTTTMQQKYGYGHTKEAAAIVREQLNLALQFDKKPYGLKISVRKADSGYGGPRVDITTSKLSLDQRYEYIVDELGNPSDNGQLISQPRSTFTYGRPDVSAKLVTPEATEKLNDKIKAVLAKFGKDDDDAMTDYFDNTQPLFYGISYRA